MSIRINFDQHMLSPVYHIPRQRIVHYKDDHIVRLFHVARLDYQAADFIARRGGSAGTVVAYQTAKSSVRQPFD
jgi:hypothetical protein